MFTKLFYCSSVCANTSKANIHKLQLVQNFAARFILGLKKFDHISEGVKSLGILKVKDRLDINGAVMVFKCLNNLAPKYLCDQLLCMYQGNTICKQPKYSSLSPSVALHIEV